MGLSGQRMKKMTNRKVDKVVSDFTSLVLKSKLWAMYTNHSGGVF